MLVSQTQSTFQFGAFEASPQTGELRKRGVKIKLREQPFQILLLLLHRPGDLVTREEIQKRLWPENTFVDFDNAINGSVRKLRDALGDNSENPRFIETLPRRGYRFIAPVSPAFTGNGGGQLLTDHFGSPDVTRLPISDKSARQPVRSGRKRFAILLLACVVGPAVVILLRAVRTDRQTPEREYAAVPLTTYPGTESGASFSPDGTRIAFSWDGPSQRNSNIYVKLIGPGDPVRLTKDPANEHDPAWSPDGSRIAFLRDLNDTERAIVLVPALGGPETVVAQARALRDTLTVTNAPLLSWSADGKWLFTLDLPSANAHAYAVFRVSMENGEKRQVTFPSGNGVGELALAVSPDGRALAFTRTTGAFMNLRLDLFVVPLSRESLPARAPEVVLSDARVEGITWTPDSRDLIFAGIAIDKQGLWRISAFGSRKARKLSGIGEPSARLKRVGRDRGVTLATARGYLVYSQSMFDSNLWRMNLSGKVKGRFAPFISSTRDELQPDYSPDGHKIAFESDRSGSEEIWVCNADGSAPFQLTNFRSGWSGSPRWSPDGEQLAFDRLDAGNWEIEIIDAQSERAVRLTPHRPASNNSTPSWSRDGRWIYFSSDRTGRFEVWKMPVKGGAQIQITTNGGSMPLESLDGERLYYSRPGEPGNLTLWSMPVNGSRETKVIDHLLYPRGFAISRRGVYFVEGLAISIIPAGNSTADKVPVRFLDFASGRASTIGAIQGHGLAGRIAVSPNERALLYGHDDGSGSDLLLVDNFN